VQCDNIAKERETLKLRFRRAEANSKATKKVMEALKDKREEILAQLKEYSSLEMELDTLKQQRENIKKQRNASILRAQKTAKCVEKMKFERYNLKGETENLRAKIKDVELLESQVNAARLLCDNIEKERNFYKLKARQAEVNRDSLRKDIYALKLEIERLRAQCKKDALLEKQLKTETQQWENIKKERNALILRVQRTSADREAMRRERDSLKLVLEYPRSQRWDAALQEEQLNITKADYDNIATETDSSIHEVKYMGTDGEAREKDLDDLSNFVRGVRENIAKETGSSNLEIQHMETDREATEEDVDDNELLEEIANLVRGDGGIIAKEGDYLKLEVQHTGKDEEATVEDFDDDALMNEITNYVR
jgi:hypothetical protein